MNISKAKRFRILARDGFKCRYCGNGPPAVELHIDHIIARADGGGSQETNLITACADCNAGKSDRRLTGESAPLVSVTNRRGKPSKGADPRNRLPHLVRKDDPNHHVLNTGAVLNTIKDLGDVVRAEVWCESHQKYEAHTVPKAILGRVGSLVRITPL